MQTAKPLKAKLSIWIQSQSAVESLGVYLYSLPWSDVGFERMPLAAVRVIEEKEAGVTAGAWSDGWPLGSRW